MSQPSSKKKKYCTKDPKEIRQKALELRELAGINDQHAPNILILLETLKTVFPNLKVKFVSDTDLPDSEARAYCKAWIIKVRDGIRKGLMSGNTRARWTIAHELGHIFLEHPRRPFRVMIGIKPRAMDRLLEREANIFAAELLAPRHLAAAFETVEQIKNAFQIGSDAAQYRLQEIRDERRAQLRRSETYERSHKQDTLDDAGQELVWLHVTIVRKAIGKLLENNGIAPYYSLEAARGNTYSAAIMAVQASHLLLSAYESIRGRSGLRDHQICAAIYAAILAVRPIRIRIESNNSGRAEIAVNHRCALWAIAGISDFNSRRIENALLEHMHSAGFCSFEFSYLRPFIRISEALIATPRTYLSLLSLPTYEQYNADYDISYEEIESLEGIMNIFTFFKFSSTSAV